MTEFEPALGRATGNGAEPARFADGFGFEARVFETDGVVVVAVAGEIDLASASLFRQAMDEACSASPRVVIDFAGTTFIDSSGLAVVLRAHTRLGRAPGAVVIRAADPRITRTFEVSGLDHLLNATAPEAESTSQPW